MSNRLNSETLATLYGILLAVILVAIVLVTGKVLLVDLPLTLSEIVGVLTLAVISAALVVAIWVQIRKEQFDMQYWGQVLFLAASRRNAQNKT